MPPLCTSEAMLRPPLSLKKYRKVKRPLPSMVRVHPVSSPARPTALPAVLPSARPALPRPRSAGGRLHRHPQRATTTPLRAAPRAPGAGQEGRAGHPAGGARQLAPVVGVVARGPRGTAVAWRWRRPGGNGRRGTRRASGGRGSEAARSWGAGAKPQRGCRVLQEGGQEHAQARRARGGRRCPRAPSSTTKCRAWQQKKQRCDRRHMETPQ